MCVKKWQREDATVEGLKKKLQEMKKEERKKLLNMQKHVHKKNEEGEEKKR